MFSNCFQCSEQFDVRLWMCAFKKCVVNFGRLSRIFPNRCTERKMISPILCLIFVLLHCLRFLLLNFFSKNCNFLARNNDIWILRNLYDWVKSFERIIYRFVLKESNYSINNRLNRCHGKSGFFDTMWPRNSSLIVIEENIILPVSFELNAMWPLFGLFSNLNQPNVQLMNINVVIETSSSTPWNSNQTN